MAKIEVGRFSELLRRYLAMAGVVDVAAELAPEISPVFVLEQERPEWEFIKNAKLCSSQISIVGAPALNATGRLRNPVGSGVVAVISLFNWDSTSNCDILVFRVATTADLAGEAQTVTRDTRWPALQTSSMIASQANVAAAGDFIYSGHQPARSPTFLPLPFVLTPGFAVDISNETDNTNLRANVHWLERPLGALERA